MALGESAKALVYGHGATSSFLRISHPYANVGESGLYAFKLAFADGHRPSDPPTVQTRDNVGVPMISGGYINQTQLANEVARAIPRLGPEVVRVRHSVGTDTSGEPSIFFRIVLSDEASSEDTLQEVTGRIVTVLFEEIRPYENWGLIPYFSFRGNSEQAKRFEPEWA